eukprot:2186538-Alexandrium_andersonii.AAC.1
MPPLWPPMKNRNTEDAVLARRIMCMAVWALDIVPIVGVASGPTCPWCGQAVETRTHLWWRCSRFGCIRQ